MFTINLHYVNYQLTSNLLAVNNLFANREYVALFVPQIMVGPSATNNQTESQFSFPYGWTCLFYTLTNDFMIDCINTDGTNFAVYINLPLTGCLASSDWQIDWAAQTITRLD
jgi:hypothetical protein